MPTPPHGLPDSTVEWLLDTDPALRWQVERDLLGAPREQWEATRARVGHEGMGADLIGRQDPDGQWAGGAYFPAGFFEDEEARDAPGQPYTATTWSLTTLREWGASPADLRRPNTAALLEQNARWEYENLPYWDGEVDVCINGWTLLNGIWLGRDMSDLAAWFPEHQLADGGWNCEWVEGARTSSVHSTMNAVKALLEYELRTGDVSMRPVRHRGEEYLLERRLLRRRRDGELIGPWVVNMTYPMRWAYSALNALDHFRAASIADGAPPDPRIRDAIDLLRSEREADGCLRQGVVAPGAVWFPIDVAEGEPSPWVTFLAARILAWWDASGAAPSTLSEPG
ncbi:MAG: squalene cyclase [Brachybacterium sp.]|nr:squalene cyclase [Brachybacterium sp.]